MYAYKKWPLPMLIFILCFMALVVGFNFVVDPLQYYRKAFYEPSFSTQQRYQNPGLVKNYDFDTIIIGTSMTENFIPSHVNEKLGTKALKLSMSESTAKEQYLIAKLAIETGKVKNVIWSVDYFALRGAPDGVRDEFGAFPFYLYDQNPLNDVNYLLNLDTTIHSFKIVAARMGLIQPENTNLDLLNTWTHDTFSKEAVLEAWKTASEGSQFVPNENEFESMRTNLDINLIPLIKQHPNINFILYYPPYSILQHRLFYEKSNQLFEDQLATKKYLFSQIGALPNVKMYDLQQAGRIIFNLDNYKDLAHHSETINDLILDVFAVNTYRVTASNVDQMLDELRTQVENVDPNNM